MNVFKKVLNVVQNIFLIYYKYYFKRKNTELAQILIFSLVFLIASSLLILPYWIEKKFGALVNFPQIEFVLRSNLDGTDICMIFSFIKHIIMLPIIMLFVLSLFFSLASRYEFLRKNFPLLALVGYFLLSMIYVINKYDIINFVFYYKQTQYKVESPVLIAHGGGNIDGYNYTNSVEALEYSISRGYKYIELDLLETSDGHIVAAHDWKTYHKMTGWSGERALDLHEFRKRKIYNKYTPMTYEEINYYFVKYNLILVTDKIENYDLLLNEIQLPPEQIFVEVFSYDKFKEALRKGIKYPMLCLWDKASLGQHLKHKDSNLVRKVTIPVELITDAEEILTEQPFNKLSVFAFTSNDIVFINRNIAKTVTGFYTDSIKPAMIIDNRPLKTSNTLK